MSTRARLALILISTPLVAFVVVGGLLGRKATARETSYQHLRVFEDVVSLIVNNYVEEPDTDKAMDGALRGLAEGLDPDSAYLEPDDVQRVEKGTRTGDGSTTGVDLTRQYYLRVAAVRDGSPGATAGLRTGDYIRAIEGQSTRELSVFEGRRLLDGPVGSTVTLTVLRGSAADPHEVKLLRAKPATVDVTTRVQTPGIGYLRISGFGQNVVEDVRSGIEQLKRQGVARLIIDLRHTSEGQPQKGLDAARLFVTAGTLGAREVRGAQKQVFTAAAGDGSVTMPIVLLTGTGTSGPAETFAAALAGNKRASMVGERTLGRAGEQKLVKLPDGSGLWLTHARFLDPGGKAIHGAGLAPMVEVEEPDIEFGGTSDATDPILERAIEEIKK
jgi:carboxyl-terminal processing protease